MASETRENESQKKEDDERCAKVERERQDAEARSQAEEAEQRR